MVDSLCLDALDYEKWEKFLFDRPGDNRDWFWDEDDFYSSDVDLVVKCTQLFKNSDQIWIHYSVERIAPALQCILSYLELEFSLRNEDVDFDLRKECIESMFLLYEKIFSKNEVETISYMWWDYIHCPFNKTEDEKRIQEVQLAVLERILTIPSDNCRFGALHGLGHLWLPEGGQIIKNWLSNLDSKEKSPKLVDYAKAAISGGVL